MTRKTRTRLAIAIGTFVALTILLPSALRESLPGEDVTPTNSAGHNDLGTALRTTSSAAIAVLSAPVERVWSKALGRERLLGPFGDLKRVTSTRTPSASALVLAAVAAALTTWLAANTSDPRAPPLLHQRP